MDSLFWWTGALLWALFACGIAFLLLELGWTLGVAISATRFFWTCARVGNISLGLRIRRTPVAYFVNVRSLLGYRKGNVTFTHEYGRWNGPGDWFVSEGERTPSAPVSAPSK